MSTMAERIARAQARGAELQKAAPAGAANVVSSPVHEKTLAVLQKLMGMSVELNGAANVPLPLRAAMATMQHSQHLILDGLAKVPPGKIQEFLAQIEAELHSITSIKIDA